MAADQAPTPTQLIQQWRDEAKSTPDAGYMTALEICAEQLEEALRPRVLSDAEVAQLTDGLEKLQYTPLAPDDHSQCAAPLHGGCQHGSDYCPLGSLR